jgi:phosphatidylglycerol:prolipoprotein diacylglycerol transferase
VLAVIPYTTFPTIDLGLFQLRTFGLMVGIGVLLGAFLAGRYMEARAGISREESYRMATVLVVAGVVGARLTWDISHWSQIGSPLDLIAVWQGGLQFSGGFLGAILFGVPFFRRWGRRTRWIALDGYAYGLSLGLAIGRIGCISVGEHFGRRSDFLLAVRYDGGPVRESLIGTEELVPGMTFHNTAVYELLYLLVIFGVLNVLLRRKVGPSVLMGTFCLLYAVSRFLTDFVRVNDKQLLGLTGAQYLMLGIAAASLWIFLRVRPTLRNPATDAADELEAQADADAEANAVADADPAPEDVLGLDDEAPEVPETAGTAEALDDR